MLDDPDEVQPRVQDAFVNPWNAAERFDPTRASAKARQPARSACAFNRFVPHLVS